MRGLPSYASSGEVDIKWRGAIFGMLRRYYAQWGDCKLVWGAEVHLECYAWASAGALAKRISEVAGRDVFGEAGGEFAGAGHLRVLLGVEVGAARFSFLDRTGAERGAAEAVRREKQRRDGLEAKNRQWCE